MNIFLIGMMGTGKSTVGQQVAHCLNYEFYDTDSLLEQQLEAKISEIFHLQGEAYFRCHESQILQTLTQSSSQVVATGGGIILAEANRHILQASGLTIWLRAEMATLTRRLAADAATATSRPLIDPQGPSLAVLEAMYRDRYPLYQACAELVIDTDQMTPTGVTKEILNYVGCLPPKNNA